MSFTAIESEIIRDADMDGSLKSTSIHAYINQLLDMVCDLREQSDSHDKELAIGCIGQALVLVCAKEDLDLTTCIRKARNQ
jgi:hypothetical protein